MSVGLQVILSDVVAQTPRTTLTHVHRVYANALLGRDLLLTVARADKGLQSALVAHVSTFSEQSAAPRGSKAAAFLAAAGEFFRLCLAAKLLVCLNGENHALCSDCFYLEHQPQLDAAAEQRARRMTDALVRLKGAVESRDRRVGLRTYTNCFERTEAVAWLTSNLGPGEEPEAFLDECVREGAVLVLLSNAGDARGLLMQVVPRVAHSGFVYAGAPNNWVRRWAVLRETVLLLFHETKKQQQVAEIKLTVATCQVQPGGGEDTFLWAVTTPHERLLLMSHSNAERDLWVDLMAPVNTVVGEENELLMQAEAIIASTTYHANF